MTWLYISCTEAIETFGGENIERKLCTYDVTLTSFTGACPISALKPCQIANIGAAFTFYILVSISCKYPIPKPQDNVQCKCFDHFDWYVKVFLFIVNLPCMKTFQHSSLSLRECDWLRRQDLLMKARVLLVNAPNVQKVLVRKDIANNGTAYFHDRNHNTTGAYYPAEQTNLHYSTSYTTPLPFQPCSFWRRPLV